MKSAFTLLEIILTLLLAGILFSIGIPYFHSFTDSACLKKLQLQTLNLRLALKSQLNQSQSMHWDALYAHLDFKTKDCHFTKQKNGFIINYHDKKAYFVLKNSLLECQHAKSARLHNGESLCDVF